MRRLTLGVIGHVDHGKTALVRALTGMETDRLAEERRRGISIALGFAHCIVDDVELDVIDMPGHEQFVRTMIAGATGIGAVLLVVAANEGVMPQTEEHVAIAGLLGIRRAVIAVSKSDLADPSPAAAAAASLVARAGLAAAPPVAVSARTGEGLPALRALLASCADDVPAPEDRGFCWLPIDRAFSLAGHGTVVTGTLRRGPIAATSELVLLPGGEPVRVRGVQVHGARVTAASPGQRVAVNLRGVEPADVPRGTALATPGVLSPSAWLSVSISVLPDAPRPLRTGETLRLLFGTWEGDARLRLLDRDAAAPGAQCIAQLACATPVAVSGRERFVLRAASPARTLGGGVVLDPMAARMKRHAAAAIASLDLLSRETDAAAVARTLAEAGSAGCALDRLAALLGLSAARAAALLPGAGAVLADGRVAVTLAALDALTATLRAHLARPEAGAETPAALRAAMDATADPLVVQAALARLAEEGAALLEGGLVRPHRPERERARADHDAALAQRIAEALRGGGLAPPDPPALTGADPRARAALDRLIRAGLVVRTVDRVQKREVLFHRDAVRAAQERLAPLLAGEGLLAREAGAALGVSRKYSIPLLEHFDAIRFTRRVGDRRVLAR
jgi:selenocysteine-specific elongation factor